ncbi:DUF397 domain-containing protein [Streptomyces sp. JH002]|uniref:DUF397 domain-containing protein n=1 Tax=Streptomyces TaxID=1883 RepID=UPI0021CF132E|nr:DUF397 domain-containing protein [Streptomyces sp. G-5]MCU4747322.1 DUF397 domain-containing protein [Streptomyces sp. G-5]
MADIQWQKSSYSTQGGDNACVELGRSTDGLLLRESDDPAVVAGVSHVRARALFRAVRRGAFERLS